jgi:hypothetical protein
MTNAIVDWWRRLRLTWEHRQVGGLEKILDLVLVGLQLLSISYLIKLSITDPSHISEPDRTRARYQFALRIEIWVIAQLLALIAICYWGNGNGYGCIAAGYFLFEMYLVMFNTVFVRKLEGVGTVPLSAERTLFLFIVNAVQIVLCFAVFYQWQLGLSPQAAVVAATLVFGTLGHPIQTEGPTAFVGWPWLILQVFVDFLFVVLFVAGVVGSIHPFTGRHGDDSPPPAER